MQMQKKNGGLSDMYRYVPVNTSSKLLVALMTGSFFMIQKIEDFGVQACFFVLWYSMTGLMIFKSRLNDFRPKTGAFKLKPLQVLVYSTLASFAIVFPSFADDGGGGGDT
jgi:hypothetical protein